jgi:hypothetical protein
VLGGIAPRDRGGGKRRCHTGSGVGLRVVHRLNKYAPQVLR